MSKIRSSGNISIGRNVWSIRKILSIAILSFAIPAYAQEVGKSVRIVNIVQGNLNNVERNLVINGPVFISETINAKDNSLGEIRLNDNSRIIVGPGSQVTLDDFVVSNGGIVSGTFNVAKGAFRFLSGKSRKGTFNVKTPLSTIGIRGTIFDIYVKDGGVTDVILFSGEIEVCTLGNICRIIREHCDILRVRSFTDIKSRNFLRSGGSGEIREENDEYNLITNQFRFPFGWQAPTASCSQRARLEIIDTPDANPAKAPTPAKTPTPPVDPEFEPD